MSPIRLALAFGCLLFVGASAHAAAPVVAHVQPPTPVTLDLRLNDLPYVVVGPRPERAPIEIGGRADARADRRRPLASQRPAPAPYRQLLPELIEDQGVGYRLWF